MSDSNPYAAPTAPLSQPEIARASFIANGCVVEAGRGLEWIKEAFRDVFAQPLAWIIGPMVVLFALAFVSMIPIVGLLASVAVPLVIAGNYAAGETQARTGTLDIGVFFRGAQKRQGELLIVGVVTGIAGFVALVIAFGAALGPSLFKLNDPNIKPEDFLMPAILGSLIFFALYIPITMGMWFAPALVLLRGIEPIEAIKQSFNACLKNFVPFLVYGLVTAGVVLGSVLTAFLGFIVTYPVLLASMYRQYRDIFEE